MTAAIRGAKGGKAGGAGSAPFEQDDNLLIESTARILDVVSEGPIEGWADPDYPAKCIYFDDTPLQNPNGSFNFKGVKFWLRHGTPSQEYVEGFTSVESEVGVGVKVERALPVARTISSDEVDAVRIKVGVNALTRLFKETGDLVGTEVKFAIDMQADNGPWETVNEFRIGGKTTSGYQRAYRIGLPRDVRPVSFRVRRLTPDSEESNLVNDLYFVSYTELTDAKLAYPNTAYVALAIPASAFGGRIPRRSYRLKGLQCWVPSNYDPETRSFDETTLWDGTFKRAFTQNPAFFAYTVLRENRWGLGDRIAAGLIDKWAFYEIGKYCDQRVPDGKGGYEPRFSVNGVMNTREAAYDVITKLSAAFRGVTYWGAGAVVPVQDAPSDPVKLVTNANVVGGQFNYSGTALAARKTAAVVSFRDTIDHYRLKAGVVYEDHDAIARFERRQADISLPFTTSRAEAIRAAKWLVDTNTTQTETLTYQAGYDHAAMRPGDRILVSDKHRAGFRMGGRVKSITPDRLTLRFDAPVRFDALETYKLLVAKQAGEFIEVALASGLDGDLAFVDLAAPLDEAVREGAVFAVWASNLAPRLFKIMANTPEKHLFNIVAIEDDAAKYDRVEQGIVVDETSPYILPSVLTPAAVVNVSAQVVYNAARAVLVASVGWQGAAGESYAAFQVDFTDQFGVRRTITTDSAVASITIPIEGVSEGPFAVHVRGRNTVGRWSAFADHEFTAPADISVPANVTGFAVRVLDSQAFLTWAKGDPVTDRYRIRFSANPAAAWNEAIDVETEARGQSAVVPALAGVYLIKAVSVFDVESRAATAVQTGGNVALPNVVETVTTDATFAGEKQFGLEVRTDGLSLVSGADIYEWENIFDVENIFSGDGIPPLAYYTLTDDVLDLGGVYTSRLSADMRGFGYRVTESVFEWLNVFDVPDIYGDPGPDWSLRLQVSTTDDDPTDPAATWADWADFIVGDYTARAFKFRVRFASDDPQVSVVLESLTVQVDMPDRIEKGEDVACPTGGVAITFDPPFKKTPAITVDGQSLPTGARSIRTSVSRAGFHQEFVDAAGDPIAATFDYVAAGYGRDTTT